MIYADRCAEVLIRKCYLGMMTHRVRIALYQGICGEATSRVRIEESLIEGFVHGAMFGENATAVVRLSYFVSCAGAAVLQL